MSVLVRAREKEREGEADRQTNADTEIEGVEEKRRTKTERDAVSILLFCWVLYFVIEVVYIIFHSVFHPDIAYMVDLA